MSPRGRKSITPKRNSSVKSPSASNKENSNLTIAKISSVKSNRRVGDLINDMRVSACKTITNVKSSFGDLSCVSFSFFFKECIFRVIFRQKLFTLRGYRERLVSMISLWQKKRNNSESVTKCTKMFFKFVQKGRKCES